MAGAISRSQNYPQSLATYDPFQHDGEAYNQRLADDSKSLFLSDGQTNLEVYEKKDDKGKQYHEIIRGTDSLDTYLKENGEKQKSRIFYIHRRNSLDCLQITKEMVRILLDHFEIFPGFLDLLCDFGGKERRSHGCKTTFQNFSSINFDSCNWEICYGLSFVEKHGRKFGSRHAQRPDPWSIRRTGVYQKHNLKTQENTWCLLHPSDAVQKRLKSIYDSLQLDHEPLQKITRLHLLFVSHATANWGLYVDYLEEAFIEMRNNALMYEAGSKNPGFEITFLDSQTIHSFEEKVLIVRSTLESNYEVLSSLQKKLEPYWSIDKNATLDVKAQADHYKLIDPLSFYLAQHRANLKNISSLLGRIQGISGLFHRIREFENIKEQFREAEHTTFLAKRSLNETEIMRKMTVLGGIFYLPVSLAATIFGMGYFHIGPSSHLKFDEEMLAFLIVSLFFAIIASVVFIWYGMVCWQRKKKRMARPRDEESAMSPIGVAKKLS